MACYFFHLHDHHHSDDEGRELPDLATAITVARDEIRDFLADQVRHGYLDLKLRIDITDETGRRVATVHRSDAVNLRD